MPKLTLDGVNVIRGAGAAAPVPVRLNVVGDPATLLVNTTLPVTAVVPVGANFTLNVLVPPAEMLSGVVSPLIVKPVPLIVALEMVSVAFPALVIVTVIELLLPSVTVPNATGDGLNEICGAAPVPVKVSVFGELLALLVIDTFPVTGPAEVGANFTVIVVEAPAFMVTGVVNPVWLNPAPVTSTWEIVRAAVPGFDTVTAAVALFPTFTVPKASLVGLNEIWASDGVTPVPVKDSGVGEPEALLVKLMLPVSLAAVVGANFTVKVVEPFEFTLTGVVRPLIVNPVPLMLAAEIVNVALPVLEMVTVCVLVLPVLTFPKATGEGLIEICGAGAAVTVADMGRDRVESDALLVIERVPDADPTAEGLNVTFIIAEAPAATVVGYAKPEIVKPVPVTLPAEMVIVVEPALVRLMLWVAVVPIATLPNVMLDISLFSPFVALSLALLSNPSRAHPDTKLVSNRVANKSTQLQLA